MWDSLAKKINSLSNWQVALVITVIGLAVFSTGLTNPFQGDDTTQIVNNPVVHSISHVKLLFEGGTFYNGQGLSPLTDSYYRPLMSTVFSLIYTFFGPHTLYFHLFQLLICIGSAILLYLIFQYSFGKLLSLILALVFLIHPIISQVVYSIPAMQDALFFFFGVLAFWIVLRFVSIRSMLVAATCLTLSLLSNETGLYFVAMAFLYLGFFDKKRLLPFIGIMALPIVLYTVLRLHAVGLPINPHDAPIDELSITGRLLTAPSIMLFYIASFIFPWKLASGYYWTYTSLSFRHVLLPLLIDGVVLALFIYLGFIVRRRAAKAQFLTYLFFAIWTILGLVVYLQLGPLDMTACDNWFYFPMVGVLGMVGVILLAFQARIPLGRFLAVCVLVLGAMAVRTAYRGTDYSSAYKLAKQDITSSKENYNAYDDIANALIDRGQYAEAKGYAQMSIRIYPTYVNYNSLGVALTYLGDYPAARQAYNHDLEYGGFSVTYENLGGLSLVYGSKASSEHLMAQGLEKYPQDSVLWMYLAIFEQMHGNNAEATVAIRNAAEYGTVPPNIYNSILADRPFTIDLSNGKSIAVQ